MNAEIKRESFVEIDRIASLIKSSYELKDVEYLDDEVNGSIFITINYRDNNDVECVCSISVPFCVSVDMASNIDIRDFKSYVIDGAGVNVDYTLSIEMKEKSEIKEEIVEEYKEKLSESIQNRDTHIIQSKRDVDENVFYKRFDDTVGKKYCIKTVYCADTNGLKELALKYGLPLDDLISGYDRDNKRVIFKYKG